MTSGTAGVEPLRTSSGRSSRLEAALAELAAAIREEVAAAAPHVVDEPERLLSVTDARKAMGGIAASTLYELLNRGDLRSVTVGRRRVIPASAIADYAARAR